MRCHPVFVSPYSENVSETLTKSVLKFTLEDVVYCFRGMPTVAWAVG